MRLIIGLVVAGALVAGCGEKDEPAATTTSAPVAIEHKFGTTEVPANPQRVVTVGFNDQDFALAVGVKPVGVRQFQGASTSPTARGHRRRSAERSPRSSGPRSWSSRRSRR